jgi:hypothetical protein
VEEHAGAIDLVMYDELRAGRDSIAVVWHHHRYSIEQILTKEPVVGRENKKLHSFLHHLSPYHRGIPVGCKVTLRGIRGGATPGTDHDVDRPMRPERTPTGSVSLDA